VLGKIEIVEVEDDEEVVLKREKKVSDK